MITRRTLSVGAFAEIGLPRAPRILRAEDGLKPAMGATKTPGLDKIDPKSMLIGPS